MRIISHPRLDISPLSFLVDYPCCLRIMNVWENRTDTLNGNALRNILLNIGMNHEKDFAYRR